MSDADMPAVPIDSEKVLAEGPFAGLSKRQLAAIELRVPSSGTPWLDDMIRESRRWDAAQAAMQGLGIDRQAMNEIAAGQRAGRAEVAVARMLADALLKSLEDQKP